MRWLPSFETETLSNGMDSAPAGEMSKSSPAHGARVILADDNTDMREYVRRLLVNRGFVVEAVPDGEAALAAIQKRRPDLVLTDVMMPRLDGFGLLRAIRTDPSTAGLPVVMLSARAGEEATVEGIEAGADDYLVKPFSARELLAKIDGRLALTQARREIYRQIAQFETLLNEAPSGVYLVDADFKIRQANPTARAVFGDIPDLIGRDFDEVIRILWPKEYADTVIDLFKHTLETGEPFVGPERSGTRLDRGVTEYYETHLSRIPLADGRYGVVCYFRDISVSVRARQALAEARDRLELSVSAAELGTFFCPMPLGEIVWNAKCKEHFFLPPDARIDFDLFYSIIHEDDRQRTREAVERAVYKGAGYDVQYRTVAKNGRMRWIRAKGRAYYDTAGNPIRFDGITIDITEQKRIEDEREKLLESERSARTEAERVSRMKDEFLATLSHELRTPLNAILGWSHILKQGGRDDEDFTQGIDAIERNARSQTQLIEDLLDMSRIIAGKVRLDVQRLSLCDVIEGAIDAVAPGAQAKGVRLDKVLDSVAGPVSGDPNRLQQVVWNLLSNAVKFTPKGGRVLVVLERVNSHVEISVTDSGKGIKPDFLPFVFERFRQEDASTTRKHGGLGLGLSIVRHLTELHGGSVRAKSPGEGQGATFTIALPLSAVQHENNGHPREHPTAEPAEAANFDPPNLRGVKVLVVDDDKDARDVISRMLADTQATILSAGSAAEGLEILQRERPDLLVSDIGMPNMDGYEFARKVRQLPPTRGGNTPAIALTAFARSEDRRRALLAGFQMHVAKPVEPAELLTICASLAGTQYQFAPRSAGNDVNK
jgi:PAS domain S-box-containing protein